ncbi:MAG: SAM-dependent methyltransferase [Pseudonocardiales bacterium]|nr:MAG: SAM-dependent methyltransferase [Pseudonocardiales bacterium]
MTTSRPPIAAVLRAALGEEMPLQIQAYDGSETGPPDAEARLEFRSPKALSYLITAPGELGLARAFVAGELDVHGDIYTTLRHLSRARIGDLSWPERMRMLRQVDPGVVRRVGPPVEEAPAAVRRALHGLRHNKRRDAEAISHHYDVSNTFYSYVLGPTMAYTCAVFPSDDATLEEAQFEKFDLVARKLGLTKGMRLLDVGCGWGGMAIHAAKHYGVSVLGVTLSQQQAEWAQKAIADEGLSDLAEVRHSDYRDVTETGFDAVSSIGLTEHVGKRALPAYFAFLLSKLRPQGRLLNHCITRPTTTERAKAGGFIDRYVFPDGELLGVGHIISTMQNTGFEVRHEENLREHYARTLAAWCANLETFWDDAVTEVGLGRARVWALYMAGSRLGFEQNKIQLHQVLGAKLDGGISGMPPRPTW